MPGLRRRRATILAVIAVFVTGLVWQSDQQAAQGSAPTGNIFGDALVASDSTYIGPADIAQQLPVTLFLQRNESALDAYLQQVADPTSANYQSAFYDITAGNNDIFYVGCCDAGVGYDMASGWGSVNFSVLATLLTGL